MQGKRRLCKTIKDLMVIYPENSMVSLFNVVLSLAGADPPGVSTEHVPADLLTDPELAKYENREPGNARIGGIVELVVNNLCLER
jgi:hypothetical protein